MAKALEFHFLFLAADITAKAVSIQKLGALSTATNLLKKLKTT